MTTKTRTYTETWLTKQDRDTLKGIFKELTGKHVGRRKDETIVAGILEAQTAAKEQDAPKEAQEGEQAAAPAEAAPKAQPADTPAQEPTSAQDEPQRVRLVGYGAYEGSEMTCPLIRLTPATATVAMGDKHLKMRLDTGRLARKRRGWETSGWALDLETVPEQGELTDDELKALPLADLSLEHLQRLYQLEVQRPTDSENRGYLIWKIREARKGNIPVGPLAGRRRDPSVPVKVLPLRMEEPVVEALDAAWKRLGASSRMAFIREALAERLRLEGEDEAARAVLGVEPEQAAASA